MRFKNQQDIHSGILFLLEFVKLVFFLVDTVLNSTKASGQANTSDPLQIVTFDKVNSISTFKQLFLNFIAFVMAFHITPCHFLSLDFLLLCFSIGTVTNCI